MTRSVFTPKYRCFCELLAEARTSRGLTQAELAKRLKRPQSFVAKYENAERRLDVVEYLDVMRAIGADPYLTLKQLESAR